MKNLQKISILFFLVLHMLDTYAQDPHLSMYYASSSTLNPATTGRFDGYYRGHLHYRTQWNAITSSPFVTSVAAIDKVYRKVGVGVSIRNDRAGIGGYNAMNVVGGAAYEITNDPLSIHHLSTGVQFGFIQKTVNSNNFTYNNQYNKQYENGDFDPSFSSGEITEATPSFIADLNFGIYYYRSDRYSIFNPFGGVSAFHLTTPNESFLGQETNLPIRYVGTGGTDAEINTFYSITPSVQYMRQGNVSEYAGGFVVHYEPEFGSTGFFLGPYYRYKDAIQIHSGFEIGEFIFRIAYDFNVSSLKTVTKGRGATEISITYTKHKGKYIPSIF